MFTFLKNLFFPESHNAITRVSAAFFKEQLGVQPKTQLVDVRTPNEYRNGHIKKAVLINFFEEDFSSKLQKLDINRPLFLYCRSGVRSYKAAKIAKKLGFTTIIDLKGGYNSWR